MLFLRKAQHKNSRVCQRRIRFVRDERVGESRIELFECAEEFDEGGDVFAGEFLIEGGHFAFDAVADSFFDRGVGLF
jgi:hypothetical protein